MVDQPELRPARLIPVAGIKGDREAEQRATSALLAVLTIVRPLSMELLTPMGASGAARASVEAFTEVKLELKGKEARPDGLIRVSYGKRSFTALVEVKTGDNRLDKDQVNSYWQAARAYGYDHVLTISNEIAPAGSHPVSGLRVQKNSPVQISHLSWTRILAASLRLKNHTGVDDPEQAWILGELVRYLQHKASGVLPLSDMGSNWTAVRDAARAGTLNRRTEGLRDVIRKLDELHSFAALMLSTEIGEDVDIVYPRSLRDRSARIDEHVRNAAEGDPIVGRVRIPNTAGDVVTEVDLRARQLSASVEVRAPEDKGARGRVGWLIRQLKTAPDDLVIEAYPRNARVPIAATLDVVLKDSAVLLGEGKTPAHRFVVRRRTAMPQGRKATARKPGFVEGYMALLSGFYETVVQDLAAWQAPAPQRRAPAEPREPEMARDDWVWTPGEA